MKQMHTTVGLSDTQVRNTSVIWERRLGECSLTAKREKTFSPRRQERNWEGKWGSQILLRDAQGQKCDRGSIWDKQMKPSIQP